MAATKMWQGTNYIERRVLTAMNKLSYIIVPQKWETLNLERSLKTLEEAIEVRDWLAAQKAPRGEKRWAEQQLNALEGRIARATQKLKDEAKSQFPDTKFAR